MNETTTEQEPVHYECTVIDQSVMALAESVGLIGPASRTHDIHAAIQRFHDLICTNATIKAAKMSADAIRESTPPQSKPLTHEQRFDLLTKFEPHKNKWEAPAILIDMVEAAHCIQP